MKQPNPDARLWLFDFDNTLAALEREVDWPGSRRELEAFLREEGLDEEVFVEIPRGNLPLYAALHTRWLRTPPTDTSIQSFVMNTFFSRPRSPNAAAGRPPHEIAGALLRQASEIIERHELIGVERAQPTVGAIDLLAALVARGRIVVIVTSNSSRTVARWLELHGISELVRAVVGRDSMLALKPSREMVLYARWLGVPSGRLASWDDHDVLFGDNAAVFVGDSEADLAAARAANIGFYGIAISHAARDRLVAAGATQVFTSPAALSAHIASANKT